MRLRSASVVLPFMLAVFLLACGLPPGRNVAQSTDVSTDEAVCATGIENCTLTSADVNNVLTGFSSSAVKMFPGVNVPMTLAVTDRLGRVLGILNAPNGGTIGPCTGNFGQTEPCDEVAVALARTASFFSNDQAPLSSRTIRYISGIHFPPGVAFVSNADLYGIENTNRGCLLAQAPTATVEAGHFNPGSCLPCSSTSGCSMTGMSCVIPQSQTLPFPKGLPPQTPGPQPYGLGVMTGKGDLDDTPNDNFETVPVNPGGVPIFKNGVVVGGIGVAGAQSLAGFPAGVPYSIYEYAAFQGSVFCAAGGNSSCGPLPTLPSLVLPPPGVVIIAGIALPFVNQQTPPAGTAPGTLAGISYEPTNTVCGQNTCGTDNTPSLGPAPEGYLVGPLPSKSGGLTQTDVEQIVNNAIATANQTRAEIRLPEGEPARMIIAVTDLDGTLLGLYRMPDATIFSIDVAVTKARNVVWFSSTTGLRDLPGIPALSPFGTAVTNRTISFGAQTLFPPGINGMPAGPFFDSSPPMATPALFPPQDTNPLDASAVPAPAPANALYVKDSLTPCTQGSQPGPKGTATTPVQSGIVFFPGSTPLYKNGVIVGGFGVSGDGVDQDDFITSGGAGFYLRANSPYNFVPPAVDRADQVILRGVRLPYWKFPRNPTN